MSPAQRLKAGEMHLITLGLPLPISLVADTLAALDGIAQKHGYEPPTLLTDGSNRIITRRRPVPTQIEDEAGVEL